MLEKIKLFFQKYSLVIFLVLFTFIIILVGVLALLLRQKPMQKLVEKTNAIIDKANDKIADINIRKTEIDLTKKIDLKHNEEKKEEFEKKIEEIKTVPDRKERLKKLIALNKSIKVPND